MTENDIRLVVERSDADCDTLKIVANGELVVLQGQGRIFIYSRWTHRAFELLPDYDGGGITVNRL